jgi:hypothetical protein
MIAFRLNNIIKKLRKRPLLILINAYVIRPVFGDFYSKTLRIPRAINTYNHYINSVNRNN